MRITVLYQTKPKNLRGEVAKVAQFLDKKLTDQQLDQLTEHLRFDNFSKNEAVNNEFAKDLGIMSPNGHFIRKGETKKNQSLPQL